MTEDERKTVVSEIAGKVQRAVKVIAAEHGKLSASVLLGLGAAAETDLAARPSHHDNEAEHDHDDFESFVLEVPRQASPEELVARINTAVEAHDVLRVKGFVEVAGKPLRLLVQGVGSRIQHQFDRPWRSGEQRQGRLVVIGERGLDAAAIASLIAG
jgi:cobalamin biosynthesis protein CobW